ncbi:MAG TPA: glycosyltransferase family 2 protein [Pyrinomonadaceae bacterium]
MSNGKIRVGIVAPVHNRRDITLQCLKSLSRIEKAGLEISVVIVDDGSTDGTVNAIKAEFPWVRLIEADGSLFFTEGTNVGIRAVLEDKPDYVLMMNDDQIFDSNFLRFMVETAEKFPRSIVGPLLLLWDTPHKLFQTSPRWETLAGGWVHWYRQTVWTVPKDPWEVDLIVGNCLLVPVRAIQEVGLMNSKRYPNFGDAEYTPRLKRRGWRLLIDPRARVFCQPNNIPARVMKMSLRQKLDALVFDLRHIHNLRRRFYACWDGAPTHLLGVLAFGIFLARVVLRMNAEADPGVDHVERPLSETAASRIAR